MTVDPEWDFDSIASDSTRTVEDNLAGADSTNALVESVLAESTSKAPEILTPEDPYVTLPGGLYWKGEFLNDVEVRELTGADEEKMAAATGSVVHWVSALLEAGVVRFGDKPANRAMINKLLIGDREELLLAIRIATFGREITLTNIGCPHCDAAMDATIDLSTVEHIRLENPSPRHEYEVLLRHGRIAVVRLPNGAAQEAIFAEDSGNSAERNSKLLGLCLVRVLEASGSPVRLTGESLAKSLGMADRQTILKSFADRQPGPKLDDIRATHEACGQEVRLPITLPDLFRV